MPLSGLGSGRRIGENKGHGSGYWSRHWSGHWPLLPPRLNTFSRERIQKALETKGKSRNKVDKTLNFDDN